MGKIFKIYEIINKALDIVIFQMIFIVFVLTAPFLCIALLVLGMFAFFWIVLVIFLFCIAYMLMCSVDYRYAESEKIGYEYQFEKPKIENGTLKFEDKYYNLDEIKKCIISHQFIDVKIGRRNGKLITFNYSYSGADIEFGYICREDVHFVKIQRVCGSGFFGNKYDIDIEIPFLNREEANDFMEVILNK